MASTNSSSATFPLDTSMPTQDVVMATMKILAPRQIKSLQQVRNRGTVSVREFSCGPHERNKVDVFLPTSSGGKRPLVLFAFGGGFSKGDKRMPPAEGSIYLNVGNYFVEQAGLTAMNVNYRLYPDHGARYPSGGEDIALALKWLAETTDEEIRDKVDLNNIFLFGTSAGAIHCATYLWCPEDKKTWSPVPSILHVRGFVCANLPAHFDKAEESRMPILKGYLGDDLRANCPITMRMNSKSKTPTLVCWSTHDLPEEAVEPIQELLEKWSSLPSDIPQPGTLIMNGHNHFSPAMALGLGGEDDAWASDVVRWIEKTAST